MKRLLLCLLLVACAEDPDAEGSKPLLADWECRQEIENELYPESVVASTKNSIETLCKSDKFRQYLAY